jgi:hypothetical protein
MESTSKLSTYLILVSMNLLYGYYKYRWYIFYPSINKSITAVITN